MIGDYFDEKYISVIRGGPETSQQLLTEKFDSIFFTGGEKVGKTVMQAAAANLTPVTLELGGKSPCIVDEHCHLQKTAKRITWGKFLNAGQTCVAPDYLLVHRNVKARLIEEMKIWLAKFYGDSPQNSPDYGRIINQRHHDRLTGLLKDGDVVIGGQNCRDDLFIAPTVVENLPDHAEIMKEEIFGPILPIIEYADVAEAIAFINRKPKPLALYVFSSDKTFQKMILSETSAGGVCINDTIVHLAATNLPFGGVGGSGFGRYHGKSGFDTFSNPKSVFRQTLLFDIPKRFPPVDELGLKMLRFLLK